jgi:hypothetical protein
VRRLILLIGAGASYGSEEVSPHVPPLGCQLYDGLVLAYPEVWGESSRLGQYAEPLRKNFEKAMYQDVTIWNPSIQILEWQRSLARYFSQFDANPGTLYRELLNHISRSGLTDHTMVVSLNYECILEKVAAELGITVSFKSDAPPGTLQVLKPHGSCHFVCDIDARGQSHLSNPGSSLGIGESFRVLSSADLALQLDRLFAPRDHGWPVCFPVMSTYSVGKPNVLDGLRGSETNGRWQRNRRATS